MSDFNKIVEYDYLIVGAGIVGLTIARELSIKSGDKKILVIEKESNIGFHASGRNSGVLHSGVYYPRETLKAKVCSEGAKLMAEYCYKHNLPIKKIGKVIVPVKQSDDEILDKLIKNAQDKDISYELIDMEKLKELEPYAKSATRHALHIPDVSIVDPKSVLRSILKELKHLGVAISFNERIISSDMKKSIAVTTRGKVKYGYLVNASGQYADKVAHMFGVGKQYSILPFKGSYYNLKKDSKVLSNGLIYPVPDLNRPFLGVHTVKGMDGSTYFGPTAVPVFGRENYSGFNGVQFFDAIKILYYLIKMYCKNKQGFRYYVHHEALNNIKSNFIKSAQNIVHSLKKQDLVVSNKSGIRPQLFDKNKKELVMDLKIEETENTLHVLNAISPAFTASFSFAELIVNKILEHNNDSLEEIGVTN